MDIAWNSSGTDDEMHVMLSGDCFYGQNITVDGDPGVYIIEAGILEPISDTDTCTGTLTSPVKEWAPSTIPMARAVSSVHFKFEI